MIVLNHFLPLALSRLTIGCLLKKVNKPARNQPGKMLIAMEGPKLEDKKIVLLTVGLAKNAAVGVRGRILSR